MSDETSTPARVRWARLRFQIIGQLLATPPESGELAARIAELAVKSWRHPSTGEVLRFSAKALGAERVIAIDRFPERLRMARDRSGPRRSITRKSIASSTRSKR